MGGPDLPEMPVTLKSIQPYLKIANEHDERDYVISYWARLYALQTGLKLSTKTSEVTNFLLKLMDWLEATKKEHQENEVITNEIAAQAHLENWALRLFLYADRKDQASDFSKNVIQAFYTAGLLYDILTVFGELSEEATRNNKYAKWKATSIYNCIKNGETPVPGPAKENDDNSNEIAGSNLDNIQSSQSTQPSYPTMPPQSEQPTYPAIAKQPTPPSSMGAFDFPSVPEPHPYNPAPTPTNPEMSNKMSYEDKTSITSEAGVELTVEQSGKAQKYIKWAGSALNYDDVPTAITNLRKALYLLTMGEDPV